MTIKSIFMSATVDSISPFHGGNGVVIPYEMIDIPYWLKRELSEWLQRYSDGTIDIDRCDVEGKALAHKLKFYMQDTEVWYYVCKCDEYLYIE